MYFKKGIVFFKKKFINFMRFKSSISMYVYIVVYFVVL